MTAEAGRRGARRLSGADGAAAVIATVALLTVAFSWLVPLLGLGQAQFAAELAALRRLVTVAGCVVIVVVLLCMAIVAPHRRRENRRRARRIIAGGSALALVGVSLALGVAGGHPSPVSAVPAPAAGTLRILSWNTDQQDVDAQSIERLVRQTHPDIVVLPEYFTTIASGTFAALAEVEGMDVIGSDSSSATLLVSATLGTYTVEASDPAWAGFVAVPERPGSPRLLVAHLQRPSPRDVSVWRTHLAWATRQCEPSDTLAIGDFNTTLANLHSSTIGGCVDAASALGEASVGSWPTWLPASLGAQIDHVFTGGRWRPIFFSVLAGFDHAGSDHRPIFAIVRAR